MPEGHEKLEKSVNYGGKRENSGRKLNVDRLVEAKLAEGIKIGEAKFWVDLAENHAVPRLREILAAPLGSISDKTLLSAVRETLDRALGKPKESIDHTTNGKDLPTPILPIGYVRSDNGNTEDLSTHEANTSITGGDVVKQDSVDALIPDSESTSG